jgi:hypothetical protein
MVDPLIAHEHDPPPSTGQTQPFRVRRSEGDVNARASDLSACLPDPPPSWSTPYEQLAKENELAWTTLEELTTAVAGFINPVLAGKSGTWRPAK